MSVPAVEFRQISKSFHGIRANQDVSLSVERASIHAIIGENGAGKTTAMKILYGSITADRGEILLNGCSWGGPGRPWRSPADAIGHQIGMVHQHFMLARPNTVLDNIILGQEPTSSHWRFVPAWFRPIQRRIAQKRITQAMTEFGLGANLQDRIETLPVGIEQRIEILKLLYRRAQILILDEPTAVLTPPEAQSLFENLEKLRAGGKTILIITHKLKEVMQVAQNVTVFRAGEVVGHRRVAETSTEELATLMVGRKVNLGFKQHRPTPPAQAPILEIRDLQRGGPRPLNQLQLRVYPQEIVGICGVEGNGQSELVRAILAPRELALQAGEIHIAGRNIAGFHRAQIKQLGVGIIPEDRLQEAVMSDRSVLENFGLGQHRTPDLCRFGFIRRAAWREATQTALRHYDVRPTSVFARLGHLSGGNQQKVVIARELRPAPRLLIAAQPTRGVDIGAIEAIYERLREARDAGCGILLISSEIDELLALADRILVLSEGRIIDEFAHAHVNEELLGLRMGGDQKKARA